MDILVYRIEDKEYFIGPYQHPDTKDVILNQYSGYKFHPTPTDDIPNLKWVQIRDYHFGFESLDKLFEWFDCEETHNLFKVKGFQVSIYKVDSDNVKVGSKQVAFKRNLAELVDYLDF